MHDLLSLLRGMAIALAIAIAGSGCSLTLGFDDYAFHGNDGGKVPADARTDDGKPRPEGSGSGGSGGDAGGSGAAGMDGAMPDPGDDAAVEAGVDSGDAAACGADQRLNDAGACVAPHPCEVDNGGCEQTCVDEAGDARCSCGAGYRLETDRKSCRRVVFGEQPTPLLYPAGDSKLLALDVTTTGQAIALVLDGATMRSRLYEPANGWSASLATVPAGATGSVQDFRVVLLDGGDEAVAVWHGYGGGTQASYIYSSVWSNDAWAAPARRDVQNYDGAYSPDLTWDGRARVTASWVTWDQRVRPHIWIEGYEIGQGWLGAAPVQPFDGTDPNSPASSTGRVIGIAPGYTLAVIDDQEPPVNLSWRIANSDEAVVAPISGNPQPGSSFYLVGNRGHASAFVISRDEGTCRARRHTNEGFMARGFAQGSIDSATATTAACPVAINRDGDGFALWVDAAGALQLARLPWDSIDSGDPAGEWDALEPIVASSPAGITSPVMVTAQHTLDMAVVWLTTTAPAALYGTVYVGGDGWSAPRRLSSDNGEPVAPTFYAGMDGDGNAIVAFSQPSSGNPGIWVVQLR